MKKLIALCLVAAMAVMTAGPALSVADTVTTGLDRGTGGGSIPIVKAKWEMKGPCFSSTGVYNACPTVSGGEGKDDSTAAGAQFDAPGVWNSQMNYTVCAIATDPNGISDIAGVYADIYYPEFRPMHKYTYPPYVQTEDPENPTGGCGAFIEQNTLLPLDKLVGYQLFCESIRNGNTNLPHFYGGYDYNEICGAEGELMKETAKVYCDDKLLIWEDTAGDYQVEVVAQDNAGNSSAIAENTFEYLEWTDFDIDFTSVSYGEVLLNTHKRISGDRNFGTSDRPTVRNLGNTRLNMKVAQDDMGLGKTSGSWNVEYDARVGNNESDWAVYSPFGYYGETPGTYTTLTEILDLSETEEMDFSILVTKWPNTATSYNGNMWLSAAIAPYQICTP